MLKSWFLLIIMVTAAIISFAQKRPVAKKPTGTSNKTSTAIVPDKKYPFVLNGYTSYHKDSSLVSLTSANDPSFKGPAARLQSGNFILSGTLPGPGIYLLRITDPRIAENQQVFEFFLDNEHTSIHLTGANTYEVSAGSALMGFSTLVNTFSPDFDQLQRLNQARQAVGTYQLNVDSINQLWNNTKESIAQKVPAFLDQYGNSSAAPFLLCTVWPLNYELSRVEGWLEKVDSASMQNVYGQAIREYVSVEKMIGMGQLAPEFVQNDTDNKPVNLKDFRGQYVLLDFWASWCGPCRLENPNVVEAYNKYKDKNFTVLGISLDRERQKWLQAINDDRLTWTHVSDLKFWGNEVAKMYKVQSIPQNFLLDPQGKIVGKNLRTNSIF